MCEVVSKKHRFLKNTPLFPKKPHCFPTCSLFLSHCFEMKNYHCTYSFQVNCGAGYPNLYKTLSTAYSR